jgi:hypothetical protein
MDLLKASMTVLSESKLGDDELYSTLSKDLIHIFSSLHLGNHSDADWKKFHDDFLNSVYGIDASNGLEYMELRKNKLKIYLSNKKPVGVEGKHTKVMHDFKASWHIFS